MSELTWLTKSPRPRISLTTPLGHKNLEDRHKPLRLDGSAKETLEQGRNRLVMAGVIFAFCFVILAGRLVGLAISGIGEEEAPTADTDISRPVAMVENKRAEIRDRNGVLLATTLTTASLFAEPKKVINPKELAAKLTTVLDDLSEATILSRLASARNFVWLKRNLTPSQQYQVNALGIPGLHFRSEEKRFYPMGALVSHVMGFTDVDNHGIAGVEKYFDAQLGGSEDSPAQDLSLSIDVRIQHALRDELSRHMSVFRAIGAAGMVMDVKTGEILGMVSLPDFDPNRPSDFSGDAKFNRITLGVYEMGSTFKTFTTAMALDSGTVGLKGGYDATEPIRKAGFRIRDDHPKKRWLSVPEIFMYSSNIGAAKMADEVGPKNHKAFLAKLGLLDKPSLEIPEIGAPILPPRWNSLETMTISFGHGLSVSPLQLSTGITAIVNGGAYINPTVIRRDNMKTSPVRQVIREETSSIMRRLMRLVVEKGTGGRAAAEGYLVGGKTGTAEKAVGGRYKRDALIASFVSAFPMNDPRYVVFAMLDEPKGNAETHGFRSAGWTAAPIVGRLISRIGPILSISPVNEESEAVQKAMFIPIYSREKKLASF
ncbi:penicillin-binding protein 2 [uncultured Sneathiella sp.]|jgi:cell division protein FtsI (penicillin-binding protein 3)|uniref:peptidoglycan D,D-transpeptidase FtsI family protein n=1 Tax=uncultured Sneathiella sp. TaxID=879315 RepID=UPI0030DDBC3B|tara:strand:- start:8355 stop:10151 length:1797 start_codon:yes stop_codon:yes gene_type:complete